jgi:DNA-directed RNA polymerase subunit M/transcription elongation factor TFIIS
MEFCEICDNLLYVKDNDNSALLKYCKHCNFQKVLDASQGALKISETVYSEDDLLYMQYQNVYLRHDPTLPRVRDGSLVCPNAKCTGAKDEPQVLYVKYHPVHMKYFYCCDYCGHTWRSEDAQK